MAALKVNRNLITRTLRMNDGNRIPIVGLGTYLNARAMKFFRTDDEIRNLTPQQIEQDKLDDLKEEKEFRDAVIFAIKHGYRHIDTAQGINIYFIYTYICIKFTLYNIYKINEPQYIHSV